MYYHNKGASIQKRSYSAKGKLILFDKQHKILLHKQIHFRLKNYRNICNQVRKEAQDLSYTFGRNVSEVLLQYNHQTFVDIFSC